MKLDHLALQVVDPLGRGGDVVVEDVVLDLLDVVLDPVDNWDVVIDDLVDDRPHGRGGTELEQVGALLEPRPGGLQLAARAPANGDNVAWAGEEADFAEVDYLLLLVVVGGLEDDEVGLVVILDLRALVLEASVLDRQLMEVEEAGELVELTGVGIVQPDPDELTRDVSRAASCLLE